MLTLCLSMTSQKRDGDGIVGNALEHQRRGTVSERPVDDVAVARHPADIGGTPVDVAVMVVEDILVGHRGIDEVAARRVQDALRLAGGARGVEDEQRVLGLHLLGLAVRRGRGHRVVVPDVASRRPADLAAGAAHDDHRVDHDMLARRDVDRLVGVFLERDRLAATQSTKIFYRFAINCRTSTGGRST